MFGLNDIPKFLLAFFLILPVISLLHEFGHVFFAWVMGGKNIRVTIGSGKPVFSFGMLEIRQYYFWYGLCTFENVERNEKFSNILIFSGGALFNLIAALGVISLIENKVLDPSLFTYQFTYFSMYYIFFALVPMPYPDGNYSDGKIILDLLQGKTEMIQEKTYRIKWNTEGSQWQVFDHDNNMINKYSDHGEALRKAREIAERNRPSKVLNCKEDKEEEIQNFPRIPK